MPAFPTRITIELEPGDPRRGAWRARTRVDDRSGRRAARERAGDVAQMRIVAGEAPDGSWTPAPYQAAPCTCEHGLCDRDHENE